MCPIRARAADAPSFPLYPMQHGVTYVNFGFWDVVRDQRARPQGFTTGGSSRRSQRWAA